MQVVKQGLIILDICCDFFSFCLFFMIQVEGDFIQEVIIQHTATKAGLKLCFDLKSYVHIEPHHTKLSKKSRQPLLSPNSYLS